MESFSSKYHTSEQQKLQPRSLLGLALLLITYITPFAFTSKLETERLLFHTIMAMLCFGPYFLLRHSVRYRLLVFFLLVFYAMFGLMDYVLIFAEGRHATFISLSRLPRTAWADLVIITGALSFLITYLITCAIWRRPAAQQKVILWEPRTTTRVAFVIWIVGIVAHFIVQFVYWIGGPQTVSMASHFICNLYYLALLGDILMVIVAVNNPEVSSARPLLSLMLVVELAFGFFGNIKEVSFRILALLLVALFMREGRIKLLLLLIIVTIFVPYYTAFRVYRVNIIQVRQTSPLEAVKNKDRTEKILKKGLEGKRLHPMESVLSFLDRIDGRKYIEIITQKTGNQIPYLEGKSLIKFFYSFLPKGLWPGKPQIAIGQLMNRTFGISASPLTFVPATQLGEFYWNFGLPGVVLGMAFVGIILSLINCFALHGNYYANASFLLVLAACYFLIIRFEGGFAVQYGSFTRVAIIIWLMSTLFKKFGWTEELRAVVS